MSGTSTSPTTTSPLHPPTHPTPLIPSLTVAGRRLPPRSPQIPSHPHTPHHPLTFAGIALDCLDPRRGMLGCPAPPPRPPLLHRYTHPPTLPPSSPLSPSQADVYPPVPPKYRRTHTLLITPSPSQALLSIASILGEECSDVRHLHLAHHYFTVTPPPYPLLPSLTVAGRRLPPLSPQIPSHPHTPHHPLTFAGSALDCLDPRQGMLGCPAPPPRPRRATDAGCGIGWEMGGGEEGICLCVYLSICMYVCMCVCLSLSLSLSLSLCVCVCVCVWQSGIMA